MTTLAKVLSAGEIRCFFQPIIDLESGAVAAYEALARGPVGPLASPDALFTEARSTGRLADLDEACRAAAFRGAIEHGLMSPLTVFVNVEPEVLDAAPVEDLLAIAKSAPGDLQIVLEITERALAVRPAELLRTVERVRSFGWGIALDDVGADSASLAFMPLLHPDVVKLDLSLIQRRPTMAIAEIMHAVNAYAERTGALILAEGIETEQHLVAARGLGATLGQGWLLGHPTATPDAALGVRTLALPEAPEPRRGSTDSPFSCLPPNTILRRATKRLLIELSKQLELEAMRLDESCVVAATFQKARHFTPSTALRYRDLVDRVGFVCALGQDLPTEPLPGLRGASLLPNDPLLDEWDVAILGPHFSAALLARDLGDTGPDMDRLFEYALTYRRDTVIAAAHCLLTRVAARPSAGPAPHPPDPGHPASDCVVAVPQRQVFR